MLFVLQDLLWILVTFILLFLVAALQACRPAADATDVAVAADVILEPTDVEVTTANGGTVKTLGRVTVSFILKGMLLAANFLVTDEIEELLLGHD